MAADAKSEALFAFLDGLGIAHRTVEHPPVFTVAESADIKLSMPGGHTKNLFLKDKKGALLLISALADTVIDLNATAKVLGFGRPSFAGPDLLLAHLGVTPGAVTAFALIQDRAGHVRAAFDAALLDHELVNFHPLRNDATTAIRSQDLLRFAGATGHDPALLRFNREGAPTLVEGAGL